MSSIATYIAQADNLRFKLLAITGTNITKKEKILDYLVSDNWVEVDVGNELIEISNEIDNADGKSELDLVTSIKEWFNSKPNNLILKNANILYHDLFLKMSPVGAFKYNSRNKNCVIFLEDEKRLGNRLYYGNVGSEEYFDQDIRDILMIDIDEIDENFEKKQKAEVITDIDKLDPNAIGRYFQFNQIKDVVDVDSDIKEEKNRIDIISSYVISESLEKQILEFFDNIKKANHKANTIIGNYGSGKSHLISFLVSLISSPELGKYIENEKVQNAVSEIGRTFFTVQFELQAVQVPLRFWFFDKIRKQLKAKYNIDIPEFDLENKDYDDKENIFKINEIIKENEPTAGLLVVIDEVSDFLASKPQELMKADLQFLRVLGQVSTDPDQDIMFIASMQEDIFSSPKFKNVASEFSRVAERFLPIIIHREDVKKVIAKRIIPKTNEQKHKLEQELLAFGKKIESVSTKIDDFVNLFPLTPFIIDVFNKLPYFEKRGVIQFATSEIKYLLNKEFPYFITFERIYDILAETPDKKNLEEIYSVKKVMDIIEQKILTMDEKYQEDALKISKALAVYSLWPDYQTGTSPEELAEHLMIMPQNKAFSAKDYVAVVVKKIREATDQQYIKLIEDKESGRKIFKFDTKTGVDPEEKIKQKTASVSDDEVEAEFFIQLERLLDLEKVENTDDVFYDECSWSTNKSFRKGYVYFCKKFSSFKKLPERDYSIVFISPYIDDCQHNFSDIELKIKIPLPSAEHVERFKDIVAIRNLINSGFQSTLMKKKLEQRISGSSGPNKGVGISQTLSKLFRNNSEVYFNGKDEKLINHVKSNGSIPEMIDDLKTSIFDSSFCSKYPLHPKFAINLSDTNIEKTLSDTAYDLIKGNLNDISVNTKNFLKSVDMIDSSGFPNALNSKLGKQILAAVSKNNTKVTDIEKEIIWVFGAGDYGLEKEFLYLVLILLTVQAKVYLQIAGGDKIDVNNIGEKFKSLKMFETVKYVKTYKESFSYDFAQKIIYSFGLNGAKIGVEEERLNIFNDYKTEIKNFIAKFRNLTDILKELKNKSTIYIDPVKIEENLSDIFDIDWNKFDISNPTQFSKIEEYLSKKNKDENSIKIMLDKTENVIDALNLYNSKLHSGMVYVSEALNLLDKNNSLIADNEKFDQLKKIKKDIEDILSDFEMFLERSHRNSLKGKIDQFKKIYIYDFYLFLHKEYVGENLSWENLENYKTSEIFKKINLLKNITCVSSSKLNLKIDGWSRLNQYKCLNHDLENQLQDNIKCSRCTFPDNPQDGKYSKLANELDSINDELEEFYNSFEKSIIKNIREYRDNIQFLEDDNSKESIKYILDNKKLPDYIDNNLIKAINSLFKEIDIIELDPNKDIIQKIFPKEDMISFEDLENAFSEIKDNILKNNQDKKSIRIKIKLEKINE
ncbi:MAG: DUF6079 family protein [Desulforegulaceae bacterium]|nr:DUF6079 family protein [Desulforegulaceae bacterium]